MASEVAPHKNNNAPNEKKVINALEFLLKEES